jgi:hypothetical protein
VANTLDEYRAALERIIEGCPNIVPKNSRITNDAVSREAGRLKGSIKNSRAVHKELIEEIKRAITAQAASKRVNRSPGKSRRRDLDAALAREASLLFQLYELRKQLAQLTGEKVVPLRRVGKGKNSEQ